jgi:hypothetical protein
MALSGGVNTMKTLASLIASLLLTGCVAQAEVYVYSNRITSLTPSAHPLTYNTDWPARYTSYTRTGSWAAEDLSDHTVYWQITDTRDGEAFPLYPVEIRDAANGLIVASVAFTGFEPGLYRGKMLRFLNETNYDGYITDDYITIYKGCDNCATSGSSGGGGSVTVTSIVVVGGTEFEIASNGALRPVGTDRNVNPRNNNTSDLGESTNQYAHLYAVEVLVDNVSIAPVPKPTSASAQVLQWSGTDGGSLIYWGNVYGPSPPQGVGTNLVFFTNVVSGGVTYTWTVPPNVSNVAWYVWGGAGCGVVAGGGGGGFVYVLMPVIAGAQYDLIVGNGAFFNSSVSAYPNGGTVQSIGGATGQNGGGYTAILESGTTNLIVVAGAGGGGGYYGVGGAGGGVNAGNGTFVAGTNFIVGAGATSVTVYAGHGAVSNGVYTNSFGGFLRGGNAFTTNLFGATKRNGAGGAGYYGGSAAGATSRTDSASVDAGGGGGNSWASSNHVSFASTVKAIYATPAAQELPVYVTGRAVGVAGADGGDGLIVVQY